MLIDEMLEYCKNDYSNKNRACTDCNHPCECPGDCSVCLYQIHYKHSDPGARHSYNCRFLSDYYVCRYSFKYTSEIIYALHQNEVSYLQDKSKLNVLSIGCGPCTDLFALDCLSNAHEYNFDKLKYIGVDLLKDTWERLHNEIKGYSQNDSEIITGFAYNNINNVIPILIDKEFKADLIIMNYLLSDFHKYGGEISVLDFLNKLVYYIVNVCPDTAIVINDINLASSLGGGRDYFDTLYRKLSHSGFRCCQLHFKNSVRGNQYNYGGQYFSNDLLFDPRFVNKYHSFAPYESCASAQIIIYKE